MRHCFSRCADGSRPYVLRNSSQSVTQSGSTIGLTYGCLTYFYRVMPEISSAYPRPRVFTPVIGYGWDLNSASSLRPHFGQNNHTSLTGISMVDWNKKIFFLSPHDIMQLHVAGVHFHSPGSHRIASQRNAAAAGRRLSCRYAGSQQPSRRVWSHARSTSTSFAAAEKFPSPSNTTNPHKPPYF